MLKIKDGIDLKELETKHGFTYIPELKKYAFYVKDKFSLCPYACCFIEEETRIIEILNHKHVGVTDNLINKGLVEKVSDE